MFNQGTSRTRYAGDGISTVFGIFFPFFAVTDVGVTKRGTDGVEIFLQPNVHYTITGAGDMTGGGQVTLLTGALAGGEVLVIERAVPAVQQLDLVTNDALPAAALEQALDRQMMAAGQANTRYSRSLRLKVTDGISGGSYDASANRITNLSDPTLDTDAATMGWVKILLAQYSQGIASVVTPGGASTAQWNANKLQGHPIFSGNPADAQILQWSAANNQWEAHTLAIDASGLLASTNTWTGTSNTFNNNVNMGASLTLTAANGAISFGALRNRFAGRFYGSPNSDRTLFVPYTNPNHCYIGALPTGAGNESGWYMFGGPDPDNAPALFISAGATNTTVQSIKSGAGVAQPLNIIAGVTTAITVRTNGRVGFQSAPDNGAEVNLGTGKLCRNAGAFQAHRGGVAQTITTGTFTKMAWTTEDFDQAGWFDTVNARYQPLVPGKYMLNWTVQMATGMVDQKRFVGILYKNGVYFKTATQVCCSGTEVVSSSGACLVDANGSTDYFELFVWHDMGANADMSGNANDCFFAGYHIG